MKYKIPLVKESFYKEKSTKKKLINFIKNCEKFSMGEETKKFENEFGKFQNSKYCVYFSSGSTANLALVQALKNLGYLKDGDKVAVSSLTWATNVMPLIQLGLNPIPVDIEIETLNISIEDLKKKYNEFKFQALFLTNVLSFSCNMNELLEFCKKYSILLFEDNCESLGSEFKGHKLANFGIAGTMSFYIGHQMSTIEGGCVVTDNEELYEMLKIVRAHGWARDSRNFDNSNFYSRFTFYDLGYNLRPGEINAFIGLEQLKLLPQNLKKRKSIFQKLRRILKNKESIHNLKILNNNYAPFAFTLVFKDKKDYELYLKLFQDNDIEIRPIISGNIASQPFFKKYITQQFELNNCNIVHTQGFYFGVNPDLSNEDINHLTKLLEKIK